MIDLLFDATDHQTKQIAQYLAPESIHLYYRERDHKYVIAILSISEMKIVTAILIACGVLLERD